MNRLSSIAMLLVVALVSTCGTDTPAITLASDPDNDLAELFDYPLDPLDIREAAVTSDAGVEVRDISYDGNADARVEAFLVAPDGDGPFGGLVFMHWGGGSRNEFLEEAKALAGAGFVSLLVDADWRPERQHFIDTVIALRRGTDLLSERVDVDTARLGYVGHSWGASFGAILTAVDQRFAAYVLMAGVPSLATFLDKPELDAFDAAPYLDVAPATSLLFQAAENDENVTSEMSRAFYEMAGEPKSIEWYPTNHRFVDEGAVKDRAAWLQEKLGAQ